MSTGILLLHGSSGVPDLDRARILAAQGYDVLAPKWFDERVSEIPLESFPLDELAARNDRLVVMGTSFGAEAALLLGTVDDRIDVVVAQAPSAYVWGWIEDGVQTSHWSCRGEPLPFVPFDLDWRPDGDPPSYVDSYRSRLRKFPAEAAAAQIPIEQFEGDLVLIAGGDDKVWPSVEFAEQIALRRGSLDTRMMVDAQAGHRIVFPGEQPKVGGQTMARGGSEQADRAFGAQIWADLLKTLAG
ncbi:esterase/lipase [Kribbella voronezhensis]|uniref:Esterase/lipase n=1 Tax=Kribbella voronezhensis TaxID=2512212 RepID=A0A4R7TFI3_9ACTN|nr:acyl-CoA thioester hydrolase/BAAT C-terminal domain-containing protein [Kribbella voronezhensis]TDU90991.1 esterase/lipase [Kribbella voronezhensis]